MTAAAIINPGDGAYDGRVVVAARSYFYAQQRLALHLANRPNARGDRVDMMAWRAVRTALTEQVSNARVALIAAAGGQT